MKTFKISEPVYRTEVLVAYNCTLKELREHLRKTYKVGWPDDLHDGDESTIGTMIRYDKEPWRVVWCRRIRKGNIEDLACLAHELFHLTVHVTHDKGVPILKHVDDERWCGDEAAAYLYESYFTQCLKQLRK